MHSALRTYLRAGIGACLLAPALATPLFAQTPPPDPDEPIVLSPFVVNTERDTGYRKTNAITATRLGTDIIDTPLSITVISRELIDDLAVDTTPQVFSYSANVATTFDNQTNILGAGSSGILIRGFQAAFIYQDSVRRYNSFHLDGIDRIEIVKGPVGLYFGRSDPGGIINFITKKPDFLNRTTLEGKYGSDQFYKAMLDHQGILGEDTLAYRVVASKRTSDSWMSHTEWDEEFLLASLLLRPTRSLEILIQGEYVDQQKTGGRVPAFVANLDYLREAGAFGGPNTLRFEDVDADGNPATPAIRLYESLGEWGARKFAETGTDFREYNGYWYPRGHTWNRNGDGTFDNNQSRSFNFDLRFTPTDQVAIRALYNYTKTDASVFWFINQDPHQAPADALGTFYAIPTYLAALANDGDPNLFTGMNYGFFESPFFNRTGEGGGIPGRQNDLNKIHTIQLDGSWEFDALGGTHTLLASGELIVNEFTQYGYVTDIDKFVAAGGFPAYWFGDPRDRWGPVSDESYNLLQSRLPELQALGLVGAEFPNSVFSGLWGNVADPDFVPPNLISWLAGTTPNSVNASDSIDKAAAISYRGQFIDGRLDVMGGVRYSQFLGAAAAVVDGERSRTADWVKFSKTTPTVGLLYRVSDAVNVYASYSANFFPRSSTPQDLIRNTATGEERGGGILPPEEGEGIEAGAKALLMDGSLSASIAIFRIDRANIPVVDALFNRRVVDENENSGGTNPWVNVTNGNAPITSANAPNLQGAIGEQRVEGLEIEGVYSPIPGLQVVFASAFNFTREWLFKPPSAVNVVNGGTYEGRWGNDGRDAIQDTLGNVPEFRVALLGRYEFTTGDLKGLYFTLGGRWQSEEVLMAGELAADGRFDTYSENAIQDAYWVVDCGAGYTFDAGGNPLKVQVAVSNALDEEYQTGFFGPAPTQEWKFTARYEF